MSPIGKSGEWASGEWPQGAGHRQDCIITGLERSAPDYTMRFFCESKQGRQARKCIEEIPFFSPYQHDDGVYAVGLQHDAIHLTPRLLPSLP